MKYLVGSLLLSLSLGVHALPRHAPVPGGVAVIDLGPSNASPPSALWGDQPLAVVKEGGRWFALLGIPLDTLPGELEIRVTADGGTLAKTVAIAVKNYPEQRLTIKDKRKVEPSAEDIARIEHEQKVTAAVKKRFTGNQPDTALAQPSAGPLSSRFGLRRFFNGEARAPHSGLDVAVGRGTPIAASAPGQVLAVGDYFFNGRTVFVDHGNGLISMYCHLERIDVAAGDAVARGQRLGSAGMTGRASGPHLHWSVILNGTTVDPELFVER